METGGEILEIPFGEKRCSQYTGRTMKRAIETSNAAGNVFPEIMHAKFANSRPQYRRHHVLPQGSQGLTLVEVMVAVTLFTIMALGSLTALIQARKMSEDNVAQVTAAVIAQGIIEQVHLNPYIAISDTVSSPNLQLKFTGADTNNLASIQQYELPWATDAITFTEIGARSDTSDLSSPILGVLIDLDYKVGTQVIRPGRYMKMRVNIRRTVNSSDHNVQIVLTYSWRPNSRNPLPTDEIYLTRELRTVRSEAPSY
jgi:prepilin-type N-terminal cleavage/methylation domain-containing protein